MYSGLEGLGCDDCGDCDDCRPGLGGLGFNFSESMQDAYDTTSWGEGDLGQQAYQFIENFAGAIPVAGPFVQGAMQFGAELQNILHVSAGRNEADIIVHDSSSGQNLLLQRMGTVTDAFRTGKHPSIADLQEMFLAIFTMGEIFKKFVLSSRFTDRRASGQALNTVMPYIDGSCGYAVPLGFSAVPSTLNCGMSWGDGTLGGPGTDGMMGALARAIVSLGGQIPAPHLTQGAGSSIATLQIPSVGSSIPPQAGWLPPFQTKRIQQAGFDPSGLSPTTIAVGLGLVVLLRRLM